MRAFGKKALLSLMFLALSLASAVTVFAAPLGNVQTANYGFFQEANGQGGAGTLGLTVRNDAEAQWWTAYQNLGGSGIVGFPASERFALDGFTVQIMQKLVFQKNDAFGGLAFLNVFDVLSRDGHNDWLEVVRAIPNPFDTAVEAGMSFEEIKQRRLALLGVVSPAIQARYLAVGDPVSQYGLMTGFKDYGNMFVVRFQRAAMQQLKEDIFGGRRGDVLIVNGGDILKELGYAGTAGDPQPPPTGSGAPSAPEIVALPPVSAPAPTSGTYPGLAYGFQINPVNDLNRAINMTKAAGFTWIKVQLRWETLEGAQGSVDWGTIDGIVSAANGAGVNLLFSVVTTPSWARRNDDLSVPGPPADPQKFADFVGAIAARHAGNVQAYEVWNEQNLWYEWGGCGRMNAGEYVDLLKRSYAAIKASDPNAVVVSGAPTPAGNIVDGCGLRAIDDVEFLSAIYAAGGKNYFDAVGTHPSGFNNPPDDWVDQNSTGASSFKGHGSFYFRRIEQARQVMLANGDGDKQIWPTEFGWASAGNPTAEYAYAAEVTEALQAQYLVRALQLAKQLGYVGPAFVWNLNFGTGESAEDPLAKRAFAVLYDDWSPRAAYNALAGMTK